MKIILGGIISGVAVTVAVDLFFFVYFYRGYP